MRRTCRVSGCTRAADTDRATMCGHHRKAQRRHGDPRQTSVGITELEPYAKQVRRIIRGHAQRDKLDTALRAIRGTLLEGSRALLDEYQSGTPANRHDIRNARAISAVLETPDPMAVAVAIVSLMLLRDQRPSRFVTDTAFRYQVARRFRLMSDVHVGEYWNARTGKMKRVYLDFSSRSTDQLGALLIDAYSRVGAHVLMRSREGSKTAQQQAVDDAFAATGEAA